MILWPTDADLVEQARRARERAYAPYSGFAVGAALLGRSGRVFTGCNVENASYSLCTCAERVAVVKAVSEGECEFEAMAVVTATAAASCGACRQILREFAAPGAALRLIIADLAGNARTLFLDQLLPESFTGDHLP